MDSFDAEFAAFQAELQAVETGAPPPVPSYPAPASITIPAAAVRNNAGPPKLPPPPGPPHGAPQHAAAYGITHTGSILQPQTIYAGAHHQGSYHLGADGQPSTSYGGTYVSPSSLPPRGAPPRPDKGAKGKGAPGQPAKKGIVRSAGGEKWFDTTLTEWPENDFRLFVGDLGNDCSDDTLAKAFNKYTSFAKAKVVRDSRSKKSKGYGFVSFLEAADMAKAIKEMDGKYIGNRPCKLRKSTWDERNAYKGKGGGHHPNKKPKKS